MKQSLKYFIFSSLLTFGLYGCSVGQLNYQIGPEISGVESLAEHANLIAVSVIDKRTNNQSASQNPSVVIASGPEDEAQQIKATIIENLKANRFKIISNKLLADLALNFHIEKLDAQVVSNTFKSDITVTSHLRLKANRKSIPFEKIFRSSLTQSVTKPAKSNEVTGVINQLLSQQLSNILTDPGIIELSQKQEL